MTETQLQRQFLETRRRVISHDFRHLNDRQQEAVMATEGPLLLLAGAGSGKTTVLINRIANLIKYGRGSDSDELPPGVNEDDVHFLEAYATSPSQENAARALSLCAVQPAEPWRIMAITFTNKAASELKARLERMLGSEAASDVWAMTFHSACVRILRRDIDRLGFDRSFTIYDTSDSQSVMKRVLKELDMDEKTFPYRSVLAAVSHAKDGMISPEEYCAAAAGSMDFRKKLIGEAYKKYVLRLREANALDFDDLILLAVKLLQEYPDVREYYQRRFRYVLVDEYQDTNNLQYLLTTALSGGYRNICVVGDDDQSIYKFRGATIENILSFEKQYKDARVIRLEQNYRSTGHILAASNAVIKHNTERKGKELWTDKSDGEKLRLFIADNENAEAQFVAGQILAGFSQGACWRDYAVLYRMNAQSNQLEFAFKRNGIPYRVVGGMRFFDRAEVKDMLAYLCVISNPADDLRLMRIVNTPPRGIGNRTLEAVQAITASEGRPAYEVLRDCRRYTELQKSAPRLGQFVNIMDELREQSDSLPLDDLYGLLLEKTGYIRMLEEKNTDENISRIENVNELRTNIAGYIKSAEAPSLAGFLEEIALYTDLDNLDPEGDSAVLMTMHSAKGLEFPTVFIVGTEDGIFPGLRAIGEPEEMEEERRLCYVAMTRAKEKLYLTCAKQRMIFGRTSSNKVSRFIDEIPEETIDKPAAKKVYDFGESFRADIAGVPGGATGSAYRRPTVSKERSPAKSAVLQPPTPSPIAAFKVGDTVSHRAFGRGVIKAVTPMAGDALVEIEFETAGKKRLMLKAASQHMEKE